MLALVVATVFSAGFGLILRTAQNRDRNLWAVGLTNYIVATTFHLLRHLAGGAPAVSFPSIALGIIAGTLYGVNFWFYFSLMQHRGVSITNAMGRLAVVVPILGGVLIWHERPDLLQGAGVALAVMALPMLTLQPAVVKQRLSPNVLRFSLALLAGNGLSMLVIDAQKQLTAAAQGPAFLAILFASAGCVALIGWRVSGGAWNKADILPGIGVGLCNALANAGLVAALQQLPGVIVFPFYSAVGLMVVALAARLIWGESLRRLEMAGMATTLLAVVMMNWS